LCPEYSLVTQAKFQSAIIALHNFIACHDPDWEDGALQIADMRHNQHDGPEGADHDDGEGEVHTATVSAAERRRATATWDQIVTDMWRDYQAELRHRGHY
jgi:hypothetical protein